MKNFDVQINSDHYFSIDYNSKERFNTFWHQFDESLKFNPKSVLEIGTGNGILKYLLNKRGVEVKILDIDSSLNPDYLGSVTDIPVDDKQFDIAVCCQVLEHIPYEDFLGSLIEINRVVKDGLILSLPDLSRRYRFNLKLHFLPEIKFLYSIPRIKQLKWTFNGEHYWNIGCSNYSLNRILKDIVKSGFIIERHFCVFEMSWHRFFILRKSND